MIKIKYIFILLILAASLYAYNLDIKPTTKIPEILQKNPQFLSNIVGVDIYPHKIVVSRHVLGFDLTNKDNQNRTIVYNRDSDLKKILNTGILNGKPSIQHNGINLYTLNVDKTSDKIAYIISILTDERNNVIWDNVDTAEPRIGISSKVFDFKKLEKDRYMVVYLAGSVIFIDYVYLDKDIPITENYQLPFISVGSSITLIPESISILTDNVIRINYKDGAIEHWKVRLSEEDIKKNMDLAKRACLSESSVTSARGNSLLWWNGVGKGSPVDHEKAKSWDYNEDTSKEPAYE